MKMAVVSMEMPSGGNSPSRRRAGTESSVPRIGVSRWRRRPWSLSGVSSIGVEVLGHDGLNRRRIGVGGGLGWPHHRGARPPLGPRHPRVWGPPGTPPTLLRCSGAFRGHFPVPTECRNRDSCPPDLGFAMAAALEGFSYRGFFVSKF